MSVCAFCGKEIEPGEELFKIDFRNKTYSFCSPSCFFNSEPLEDFKHKSLSSVVLNKTFFEILAIITGFGGVYYTIFDIAERALILDTFSVVMALAAMVIGIEHLRYVEEHDLIKKAVILTGIVVISSFLLLVWHFGSHIIS